MLSTVTKMTPHIESEACAKNNRSFVLRQTIMVFWRCVMPPDNHNEGDDLGSHCWGRPQQMGVVHGEQRLYFMGSLLGHMIRYNWWRWSYIMRETVGPLFDRRINEIGATQYNSFRRTSKISKIDRCSVVSYFNLMNYQGVLYESCYEE